MIWAELAHRGKTLAEGFVDLLAVIGSSTRAERGDLP
jgi:hypothetical protein